MDEKPSWISTEQIEFDLYLRNKIRKPVNSKYFATVNINPCNEIPLEGNHKRYDRNEIAKDMDPILRLMKKMGYE
jgi:hypothetical protein